jgi:dTDP-glucose pyrophosphorylase
MINVLILAATDSLDFGDLGYPPFLTEVGGVTLLEMWVNQAREIDGKVALVVNENDVVRWNLLAIKEQIGSDLQIVSIKGSTSGATCTALLALAGKNLEEQLIVLNGNEYIDPSLAEVVKEFDFRNLDAGLVYFDSVHPRYSYARINDEGLVLETVEKHPISRNATAGFYWYKSARIFVAASEDQLLKRLSLNGNYYVCPLFNEIILRGKVVGGYSIPSELHHSLKSTRQLDKFKESEK